MPRHSQSTRRPERAREPAPGPPQVLFPRLGKYVIQWTKGSRSRIEFLDDPAQVNRRLGYLLYVEHHSEAQARLTTWSDVVLHYQNKL